MAWSGPPGLRQFLLSGKRTILSGNGTVGGGASRNDSGSQPIGRNNLNLGGGGVVARTARRETLRFDDLTIRNCFPSLPLNNLLQL